MPRKSPPVPAYKKHPNGQAYVYHRSINRPGHVLYLGPHGSEQSVRKYQAFLKCLEANAAAMESPAVAPARVKSRAPSVQIKFPDADATIAELVAAYVQHCDGYYRNQDGERTKEFSCTKEAMGPMVDLFGDDPAIAFGPEHFDTYRNRLIALDYCRKVINSHAGRVRRMFRWATAKNNLPASIWQTLAAVEGLKAGRTTARESPEIPAVAWENVELVLPHLSPVVATMIEIQFWCGMRPQDVCRMQRSRIDMSGDIWLYRPQRHKGSFRGHSLTKAIPARVQEKLKAWFRPDADEFLFSPQDAIEWVSQEREKNAGVNRTTPVYPSELKSRARKKVERAAAGPKKRNRYRTDTYRQAVEYGLAKLNASRAKETPPLPPIPPWSPMQLRHGIATYLEQTQGRQAAAKYLGHRHLDTTGLYVERDAAELVEIARKLDARANVAG